MTQVDCLDEICRISAARRKARDTIGDRLSDSPNLGGARAGPSHPRVDAAGPAKVLITLNILFYLRHGEPCCSAPSTIEGTPEYPLVEALYGAEAEDMVDLVQAGRGTIGPSEEGEDGTHAAASTFGGDPMVIVGFSIDVGPACRDDAIATKVSQRGRTDLAPGEVVASAILSESIDATVTVAVDTARRFAVDAAAALTGDTSEDVGKARDGVAILGVPTVVGAPPPLFSFRRLHVTGLSNGGARGDHLTALKATLAYRFPAESSGDCGAVGTTIGRPVVVSADATKHLAVAGGVWSTFASIIGRKSFVPATGASSPACLVAAGGVRTGDGGWDGTDCASLGAVETDSDQGRGGGAMYYIDDGCCGSLRGALLHRICMQPSSLPHRHSDDLTNEAAGGVKVKSTTIGENNQGLPAATTAATGADPAPPAGAHVPCTVWGPTCDGLDCVSRVTQLPDDMEPGRDWLFFPDMGLGAGVNKTGFNGLKPLDACYCIGREERVVQLFDSIFSTKEVEFVS